MTIPGVGEDVGQPELTGITGDSIKWSSTVRKMSGSFL